MPTGPKHWSITPADDESQDESAWQCRCVIGIDHYEDGGTAGESLHESDAEDIWRSSGMDEDYDFR